MAAVADTFDPDAEAAAKELMEHVDIKETDDVMLLVNGIATCK